MDTESTTLIVVIANLILQPLLQYLIHSRCTSIRCCGISCERAVLDANENVDLGGEN